MGVLRSVVAVAVLGCVCLVATAQNGAGTPLAGAQRGDAVRVELKQPVGRAVRGNLLELRSSSFVLEQRGLFSRYHPRVIDYTDVSSATWAAHVYKPERSPGVEKAVIVISVVAVAIVVFFVVLLSHAHVD